MGYVEQTLAEGEQVVCSGKFHWLYTLNAALRLAVGAAAGFAGLQGGFPPSSVLDFLLLAVAAAGFLGFLALMVRKWTTEIAITNRRLVYKRGWVARNTEEIRLSRIEEVNVSQSVAGRIFGYGEVLCKGMGVGDVNLPSIARPLDFRRALHGATVERPASPS